MSDIEHGGQRGNQHTGGKSQGWDLPDEITRDTTEANRSPGNDSPDGELPDSPDVEGVTSVTPGATAPRGDIPHVDPDTFDRAYVEKLRAEAAEHRVKAKRAEEYAQEVFYGRVAALGKLADPTDLNYDEALLEDRSAMEAAVDELVSRKPHLADRRPTGDVDQGPRPQGQTVDLAGMLRSRAG